MSQIALWSLVIGGLLLLMAIVGSIVEKLPVTPAMIYLGAGYLLGPAGFGLHHLSLQADAALIQTIAEISIGFSLFAVGMRLRTPLGESAWHVPIRLAIPAMLLTIFMLTVAAMLLFDMPLGAAIIIAASLAPTDPVLASEIRGRSLEDRDNVRFGLTAEGGLNDGLSAPIVLLGLGLLGLHPLGSLGLHWLAKDVCWLIFAGLAIGWIAGASVGRAVTYLRSTYFLAIGFEEFLCIGVIAVTYGIATMVNSSGFLAVFSAGLSLRHFERRTSIIKGIEPEKIAIEDGAAQINPEQAPAHMTRTLSAFNIHAERIGEIVLVLIIGGLLGSITLNLATLTMAVALLFICRPLAVLISLIGSKNHPIQKYLMAWLGLRGVGSLYYLTIAIQAGTISQIKEQMISVILLTVALSIVVHGVTATPLMRHYSRRWSSITIS